MKTQRTTASVLDYMKDGAIFFLVMALIFMLWIIFISKTPKELIALDRSLEQITYEDDTAYIHFQNDDTDYVFYEFDDVTLDCLKVLQTGDTVTVYVFEDYQNFTYALITKMIFKGEILFDSAEHDSAHNQNVTFIVCSIFLTSLAAILTALRHKGKPIENTVMQFEIRNPYWVSIFARFFIAMGLSGFLSFTLLYGLGRLERENYPIAFIFLFFSLLGGLLLYTYIRESFSLKNGVYTYVKPFKRAQSVSRTELKCVTIEPGFSISRIVFYDKNDTKVMHFYDDGSAFTGNLFIDSLKAYDIPLIYKHNPNQTRK